MNKIIIALTGPSGVGKNTLCDFLVEKDDFVVPMHTTTREYRCDDPEGFYRYLTHQEFRKEASLNNFLYWSGDSDIIDKRYGNYYGMLKDDYLIVSNRERIIIFISYKDIDAILYLKSIGYNIEIINLVYRDIEKSMINRLINSNRNHSDEDIRNRINCAIEYEMQFGKKLEDCNALKIYSDLYDADEVYRIVRTKKIK